MKKLVVLQHLSFENLGVWHEPLSKRYEITYYNAAKGGVPEAEFKNADLTVVLGGPLSANDEAIYPCVSKELDMIFDRINDQSPILGVCLGAQMIGKVLGTTISSISKPEIGYAPLTKTYSILEDLAQTPVLHWHGEQTSLPQGATLLASTELCEVQAFVKDNILGFQCHLEADPADIESWLIGHCCELNLNKISPQTIRDQAEKYGKELEAKAKHVIESWIKSL